MISHRKRTELMGAAVRGDAKSLAFEPIGASELRERISMYERWRDESILSLPKERGEALFGGELREICKRVRASCGLKLDGKGKPRALRRFSEAGIPDNQTAVYSLAHQNGARTPSRLQKWAGHVRQRLDPAS